MRRIHKVIITTYQRIVPTTFLGIYQFLLIVFYSNSLLLQPASIQQKQHRSKTIINNSPSFSSALIQYSHLDGNTRRRSTLVSDIIELFPGHQNLKLDPRLTRQWTLDDGE